MNSLYPDGENSRGRRFGGSLLAGLGRLLRLVIFAVAIFVLLSTQTDFCPDGNCLRTFGGKLAEASFPEERTDPRSVDYSWEYKGHAYALSETLYGNIDAYYQKSPAKSYYEGDSEEEYYGRLAGSLEAEQDDTLARVARDLSALGQEHGLSSEGTLELAVAFVQAIPYDQAKYELVVASQDADAEATWPRLPYEVLYDEAGICTDKSLLAVALAGELGYGTALFESESEQHMAAAIECTQSYSSYGSGYCYTEVTAAGFRIGDADTGGMEAGRATARSWARRAKAESDKADWRVLGRREGGTYEGIVGTVAELKELDSLETRADDASGRIEELKAEYARAGEEAQKADQEAESAYRQYQAHPSKALYARYEQSYRAYGAAYDLYKAKGKEYEAAIGEYNALADEYNGLLETFYE